VARSVVEVCVNLALRWYEEDKRNASWLCWWKTGGRSVQVSRQRHALSVIYYPNLINARALKQSPTHREMLSSLRQLASTKHGGVPSHLSSSITCITSLT
jgi:hypothetical protein